MLTFASRSLKREILQYWAVGERIFLGNAAITFVAGGVRPDPSGVLDCAVKEAASDLCGLDGATLRRAIGIPGGLSLIMSHCAGAMGLERGMWWTRALIETLPPDTNLKRITADFLGQMLMDNALLAVAPGTVEAAAIRGAIWLLSRYSSRGPIPADILSAGCLVAITRCLVLLARRKCQPGSLPAAVAVLSAHYALRALRHRFETSEALASLDTGVWAAVFAHAPDNERAQILANLEKGAFLHHAEAGRLIRQAGLSLLHDFAVQPGAPLPTHPLGHHTTPLEGR